GSGSADAGSPSGGDGGIGANECTGLAPGTVAVQTIAGANTFLPAAGTADGNGTVVVEAFWPSSPRATRRIVFYSPDGAVLASEDVSGAQPLEPLTDGFAGQVPVPIGGYTQLQLRRWSGRGEIVGHGAEHFGTAGYVADRGAGWIYAGLIGDGSPTAPYRQLVRRVELPGGGTP